MAALGRTRSPRNRAKREAWLASALNLIELRSANPVGQYQSRARMATVNYIGMADNRIDLVSAVLGALIASGSITAGAL